MMRLATRQQQVATCNSSGDEKSAALDAVGDDGVRRAVQARDALHSKSGGAHASDFGSHFNEEFGEISNFRLERRILKYAFTFREYSGSQNIFRAGYGDFRETESCAAQTFRARFDVAMFHLNLRAKCFQSLNVNVDWTRSDGASARE